MATTTGDHVTLNTTKYKHIKYLGELGYNGTTNWYANKAALRQGRALSNYRAYATPAVIDAMNNVSHLDTPNVNLKNCSVTNFRTVECKSQSGNFYSKNCPQNGTTCGAFYHGWPSFSSNIIIEKQIRNLSLSLRIVWISNFTEFIDANIDDPTKPILFYYWKPTRFVTDRMHKLVHVKLPVGELNFKEDILRKYASYSTDENARKFLENFKISETQIENLLSSYSNLKEDTFETACQFLKDDANLQPILQMIPKGKQAEPKILRIARNNESISSVVISKVIEIMSEEYLETKVDIVDTSSDAESMDRLIGDKIDLISEIFLNEQQSPEINTYDYHDVGLNMRLGIYLHIPKSLSIKINDVNHCK